MRWASRRASLGPPPWSAIVVVVVNCVFAMQAVGYQMIVLNVPQAVLEAFVNSTLGEPSGGSRAGLSEFWSLLVALQPAGALVGCVAAPCLMRYLGRKLTLVLIGNALLLGGSAAMAVSGRLASFALLCFGRAASGVATGLFLAVMPVLIMEISPKPWQGPLGCVQHIFVCLGSTIAIFLGSGSMLGTAESWPYLFCVPAIGALMHIAMYPLFPESPPFLASGTTKGSEDALIRSILFYHARGGVRVNPYGVMAELRRERRSERAELAAVVRRDWRVIGLGALLNFAQVFSGFSAISSYSTELFSQLLGLSAKGAEQATLWMSLLVAALTVPSAVLVETVGRRPLLLATAAVVTASNFALFALTFPDSGNSAAQAAFLVVVVIFVVAYNLGIGPLAYFMPAELVPGAGREVAVSVGAVVYFASYVASVFPFYPLQTAYGGYAFLLFAIPSALCLIVFIFCIPETRVEKKDSASVVIADYGTIPSVFND